MRAFVLDALLAYSRGQLSRSVAMQRLGIDWYGDLLRLMNEHGVPVPRVRSDVAARMAAELSEVLRKPRDFEP